MTETVIATGKGFNTWYAETFGPIERQLGVEGREEIRSLCESNGFRFLKGDLHGEKPAQTA